MALAVAAPNGIIYISKEIDGSKAKLTFNKIDSQSTLVQLLTNLLQVCAVFVSGEAGNEDVIVVDEQERKYSDQRIHEELERLCIVFKTEWHS